MLQKRAFASSLLWLLGLCRPWGVQSLEFLDTLADLTVGANLLEDLAGSVASATELPSLSDLGEALRQAAGFDPEQLQHLTQEQRQHIDLAQSFFLSPFGMSLDSMNSLPRLAASLTGSDSVSSRANGNSSKSSSSSSSSSLPKLPFSLRGVYGLDTAELERLAETIAEGVANSTSVGLRTMNPLALAASAAAAARKAAGLTTPSVDKREDGAAASGTTPSAAAAAAVANLVEPLGIFNLHQQAAFQKKQLELQAELQKTLLDLKNEKQLKEQLEKQQQQLEEQQQQLEEQQQQLEQQQLRQQLQQQLLLEQQKEQQLLAKSKEAGSKGAAGSSGDRGFFGVRLGSDEEAAATATAGESSGAAGTETAAAPAAAAPAAAAPAAAKAAAVPAAQGASAATAATAAAAAADAAPEEISASITSGEAEATSVGVATLEGEEEEGESGDEETQTNPQRFWSRTNPLGPLQPASDMLYLLKWSLLNPLAILEWKKYSFNQCMDIYNDPDICANYLKVEPNSLNHGGLNSPWVNNTGE